MLKEINETNLQIFHQLVQPYEKEFSSITKKQPDQNGIFALDTLPQAPIKGYLWYEIDEAVGFILFNLMEKPYNINEFYIEPNYRRKKLGEKMLYQILDLHRGSWQVKQIQGAHQATSFWRKAIARYTNNQFTEDTFYDSQWGVVTRQLFNSK